MGLERNVECNLALLAWARMDMWVMSFGIAVIVPYWESRGVTLSQGLLLQAIFAFAIMLAEIPSGYLADVLGRKTSIVLGGAARVVGVMCYCFGYGFWAFLAAEILLAIALAFDSGADEALLQDTLLELGRPGDFKKEWGRMLSLHARFAAVGCVAGGLLSELDLALPFKLTLAVSISLQIARHLLVEPIRSTPLAADGHLREILAVTRWCFKAPPLRYVLFANCVTHVLLQTGFWLYQPYFESVGIPLWANGWLFAAMQFVMAFAAKRTHAFTEKFGERAAITGMLTLTALGYLLCVSFGTAWSVAFVYLHQIARGMSRVIYADQMNRHIGSSHRATVISARNMVSSLAYTVVMIGLSVLMEIGGPLIPWITLGTAALFAAIVVPPGSSKV
jgi:MFS family permease